MLSVSAADPRFFSYRSSPVVSLAPALQPSHSAYRHDGAGGELGANYVDGTKMKRVLHYLRIGWTVLFAVLCVLLIALWAGSYWQFQLVVFRMNLSNDLRLVLSKGQLAYCVSTPYSDFNSGPKFRIAPSAYLCRDKQLRWLHYALDSTIGTDVQRNFEPNNRHRSLDGSFDGRIIVMPLWLLSVVLCVIAAAPWLPWSKRFSLRTLLIIITVIAFGLWFTVWMARK